MMSIDSTQGADENPENKGEKSNQRDVIRRCIAEGSVLGLYFLFEFPSAWNESHERALIQVVVGLSAVVLIEVGWIKSTFISLAFIVLAYGYYLYKGPT